MNREQALEYLSSAYRNWPTTVSGLPTSPGHWSWMYGPCVLDDKPKIILSHSDYDPITEHDWMVAKGLVVTPAQPARPANKYQRTIKGATLDVYDVLAAWDVRNPAVQHAVKKLLQPGTRGHKDKLTDLREAFASIERAIELETSQHG